MKQNLLITLISACLFWGNAFAQVGHFDLRFRVHDMDCAHNMLYMDLEIKASSPADTFRMGNAEYRFSFNRSTLANPVQIASLGFSGLQGFNPIIAYGAHTNSGSLDTVVGVNTFITYGFSQTGQLVDDNWVGIARIRFDVIDPSGSVQLNWHRAPVEPSVQVLAYEDSDGNWDGNGNFFKSGQGVFAHFESSIPVICRDRDNDRDGVLNIDDIDDDNDGLSDFEEICGFQAASFFCLGANGDPMEDMDNDGIINYRDENFCLLNSEGVCKSMDIDGDGIINIYDLDSDGDGISDLCEGGGDPLTQDVNRNGIVDCFAVANDPTSIIDSDGDGWCDTYDSSTGTPLEPEDPDRDGLYNHWDIDSDNDGISDIIEWQSTWQFLMPTNVDRDGDGLDSIFDVDERNMAWTIDMLDTDLDGKSDYVDYDSDNDGIWDYAEGWDTDGNGLGGGEVQPNCTFGAFPCGSDADLDGILDVYDQLTFVEGVTKWGDNARNQALPTDFPYNSGNVISGQGGPNMDWREASPFPVEFLSFEATLEGRDAHLTWQTGSESNSSYFSIERTVDGRIFETIGQVEATGNSTITRGYSFLDLNALSGNVERIYYRLKQVDTDGSFMYSDLVELVLVHPVSEILLHCYPNPLTLSTDRLHINMSATDLGEIDLFLLDTKGKVMAQWSIENETGQGSISLPLPQLPLGIYYLRASNERTQQTVPLCVRP